MSEEVRLSNAEWYNQEVKKIMDEVGEIKSEIFWKCLDCDKEEKYQRNSARVHPTISLHIEVQNVAEHFCEITSKTWYSERLLLEKY